jgi:hypothetical protein
MDRFEELIIEELEENCMQNYLEFYIKAKVFLNLNSISITVLEDKKSIKLNISSVYYKFLNKIAEDIGLNFKDGIISNRT